MTRADAKAVIKSINRRMERIAPGGYDGPTFHAVWPEIAAWYQHACSRFAGRAVRWPAPHSRRLRRMRIPT